MKCRKCGKRFAANRLCGDMGGQESPGTFFLIAAALVIAGPALLLFRLPFYWVALPWLPAAFVLLQCFVSMSDCWNVPCPSCGRPHWVWPWSR